MTLIIKQLGTTHYADTLKAMQDFTLSRETHSADELWITEHFPVFTLGQTKKTEHLLNPGDIPVIQSDRGGEVTYHGPGQMIAYCLIDIKRENIGVRQLVSLIEQSVIDLLALYDIAANSRKDAPGVYVNNEKIASIGLRIKNGRSYHGISFNLDMDLSPFSRINPCGYRNLKMTQLSTLIKPTPDKKIISQQLTALLYTAIKGQ